MHDYLCQISEHYFIATEAYVAISLSLTEHAESVVHGHHDHVAVGGQHAGVEHVSGAFHVGAAVDKQHHWLLPAVANICTHKRGGSRATEEDQVSKCI